MTEFTLKKKKAIWTKLFLEDMFVQNCPGIPVQISSVFFGHNYAIIEKVLKKIFSHHKTFCSCLSTVESVCVHMGSWEGGSYLM